MSIHNPPFYRYSLFEEWDKVTFNQIKQIGKNRSYPKVVGSESDKNQFLTTLIRTQKSLHDWRGMLKDVLKQVKKNGLIDMATINNDYPPESIGADVPAWVTYEEDKIVSDFIDKLATMKIYFQGTNAEIGEFVVRFILGQLGHDWEQTIIMIWEMLGEENTISVKSLNKEMKSFDYLRLFD